MVLREPSIASSALAENRWISVRFRVHAQQAEVKEEVGPLSPEGPGRCTSSLHHAQQNHSDRLFIPRLFFGLNTFPTGEQLPTHCHPSIFAKRPIWVVFRSHQAFKTNSLSTLCAFRPISADALTWFNDHGIYNHHSAPVCLTFWFVTYAPSEAGAAVPHPTRYHQIPLLSGANWLDRFSSAMCRASSGGPTVVTAASK